MRDVSIFSQLASQNISMIFKYEHYIICDKPPKKIALELHASILLVYQVLQMYCLWASSLLQDSQYCDKTHCSHAT
jgi:hypothetical protein